MASDGQQRRDASVAEVARMCACSMESVRGWIGSGKVRAYRLGGDGAYRIPWQEIERIRREWMERAGDR